MVTEQAAVVAPQIFASGMMFAFLLAIIIVVSATGYRHLYAKNRPGSISKAVKATAAVALFAMLIAPAYAIPQLINVQGKLTDQNNLLLTGQYNFTFRLYSASTGGTLLWNETRQVTVTNGIFSTLLGATNPINATFREDVWLEVVVNGETQQPRFRVGSSAYALRANITQLAIADAPTDTPFKIKGAAGQSADYFRIENSAGATLLKVDSSGNIGIGSDSITGKLNVHTNSGASQVFITTNTNLGSANDASLFFQSDNDGTPNSAGLGQFSDGSLRFTGASSLVTPDIVITDAGDVGIATIIPSHKLAVNGSANITGTVFGGTFVGNGSGLTGVIAVPASSYPAANITAGTFGSGVGGGDYAFPRNVSITNNLSVGAGILFVDTASNRIGIGTTSPSARLHVNVATDGNSGIIASAPGVAPGSSGTGIEFRYGSGISNTNIARIMSRLQSGGGGDILFQTAAGGADAYATQMILARSGNVGIGSTSPNEKLAVGGNASVTGNFAADGSTLFVSASNDRTGIGTDMPSEKLHVVGNIFVNSTGTANSTLSYNSSDILLDGSGWNGTTAKQLNISLRNIVSNGNLNSRLGIFVNNSERVSIDSQGNVGIGTASPSQKLNLVGDANITTNVYADRFYPGGQTVDYFDHDTAGIIKAGSGYTYISAGTFYVQSSSVLRGGIIDDGGSVDINDDLAVDTNTIFVNSTSDRVGIGTASPDYTTELSGATAPKFALTDTGLAHGITTFAQTDSYFMIEQLTDDDGGARLWGLSDSVGQNPLRLIGAFGNTDPTDTVPAIWLIGGKRSGTSIANLADAETLLTVSNNGVDRLTVIGSGKVGINTTSPADLLEVEYFNSDTAVPGISVDSSGTQSILALKTGGTLRGKVRADSTGNTVLASTGAGNIYFGTPDGTYRMIIFSGGNVNIGTGTAGNATGAGDLYVTSDIEYDGSIYGPGADVAEKIRASDSVEAGDVVEIDANHEETIRKSPTAYNTKVAGIVSSEPGIVLGKNTGGVPLAVSGRVPVKVSAENGAIRPGDLLTTSSTPGHAMKCESVDRCKGSIVAKAMGKLDSGTGVITALLMLG